MKSGKFIPIELLNTDFYGISATVTAAGESPLCEHEYDLFDIISRDSHAAILIKNYILNDLDERYKDQPSIREAAKNDPVVMRMRRKLKESA